MGLIVKFGVWFSLLFLILNKCTELLLWCCYVRDLPVVILGGVHYQNITKYLMGYSLGHIPACSTHT